MDQVSLVNSMQGQISELRDKITALEAMITALKTKNDLMEQVNVQLFSSVMSQADKQARLKSLFDQRTQEYHSTTEFLRSSINILSAEIQELRRFAASRAACGG